MNLYEILVPTLINKINGKGQLTDELVPIKTRYHKDWDSYVKTLSGGLTILKPVKGLWVDKSDRKEYNERMIPVRIACSEEQIKSIAEFTKQYYRQLAVMYYQISDKVFIV